MYFSGVKSGKTLKSAIAQKRKKERMKVLFLSVLVRVIATVSILLLPLTSVAESQLAEPALENIIVVDQQTVGAKQVVKRQFETLFNSVTDQLANQQEMYIKNPVAYHNFLTSTVIGLWDTSSTTRALVGKARYQGLAPAKRDALIDSVDKTLMRYAFEGLENYGGQTFKIVDVVVNEKQGMGWVQVLMASPMLPDINLDVLIKRMSANTWRAVDVRVKGITYVAIKKHKYREILEEQGIDALIDNLGRKNAAYFLDVCATSSEPEQMVGNAPC